MESFAKIYEISVEEVKTEYADEYEKWKKLKYSISSSITRLLASKKITQEEADLFRVIIARANYEELEEVRTKVSSIRAGMTKVEELKEHVAKHDVEEINPKGKYVQLSEQDKQAKLELNRTLRLIADHKKHGHIEADEALERAAHARSLKTAKEIFAYRESLKRHPVK